MTLFGFFLILLVSTWLLTVVILLFHRNSTIMGLFPLTAFVGGLTVVMQLHILGYFQPEIGGRIITMLVGNYALLPAILVSLLIVYIANGSIQARVIVDGIFFVVILVALIGFAKLYFPYADELPGFEINEITPLFLIAQVLSIIVATIAMFVFYQSASNIRSRFPSRFAGGMALLLAVWVETLIYHLITSISSPNLWPDIGIHLAVRSLLALTLLPLLNLYLSRVVPKLPNSLASLRRPALDFFMSFEQLESRAQYSQSLLRTLSQISQLIVHSTDAELLLQQACDALVELRKYHMVWIGTLSEGSGRLNSVVQAGFSQEQVDEYMHPGKMTEFHHFEIERQAVIVNDIRGQKPLHDSWGQMMLASGCRGAGTFPMRYGNRILGILNVGTNQPNSLEETETDLLQELADDLAYALISLEAHKQQAILHTATETMQDGLLIADLHGKIIYANSIIAEIVGVEPAWMPGKNIDDLFTPEQLKLLPDTFSKLTQDEALIFDLPYQTLDGRLTDISTNAAMVKDSQGNPIQLVANVRDISHLREYERQLLNLNRLTGELVQIHDTQVLMNRILEMSEELLGANASGIYFADPATRKIIDTLTHNLAPEYAQRIAQDYRGLPGETASKTLQPVFVNDILNDSEYGERIHFMAEYEIRSLLILPILFQGQPMGALTVYYPQPHVFSESRIQLGLTLAQTLAIVIQNARLYQAELTQRELAEALTQAAASVSSSLELVDVLDQILVQAMRVVPCQAANIMLIERDKVILAHHKGYENFVADASIFDAMEFPMSWPGLQEMYTKEVPVVMMDTQADDRWQPSKNTDWLRSFIGIPLKVDLEVVGFLNIDSDKPNFLTEEYLPRLQTFADYASTAIKNARSYESSLQRAEELAALVSSSSAVSKNLDYLQVLQVIATQMTKLLRIQACVILSYDPGANLTSFLVEYGLDNPALLSNWGQLDVSDDFPIISNVLDSNIPFQFQADAPDITPILRQFMQEAQVNSLLMLPLVTQDRTIGLVVLLDETKERVFSEREISLGLSLTSHAATALENAHLYQQLQEHAAELELRVQIRTQELQKATEYIEGILASVPDAVFVLDQEHQLTRANQAGERLLSQAQTIGLNLFNPKLLQILENDSGPDIQSILEVGERAYQGLSSQLLSDEGQPSGQIIVFRDVTRFRELDQMKTQFVSDVSHELRTPLTNLTLYLSLLSTVRDQYKQNEYIQTLQRETDRLTHLIEDLLTISRLEASHLQFHIQPTNLNQLTENLIRDRTILATQKDIALEFTPAATIPLASADKNMITQALSNLLTNAINYTLPDGSIHVYTAQPEPDWVTIHISDTGVGIPPEELEHIFARFYRGRASQQTSAEGTGLGLAISEEIIHRMGGKITLESIPGEGSTFTIWLKSISGNML